MMFRSILLVVYASAVAGFQVSRSSRAAVSMMAEKSTSMPFMPQPPNLVGLTGQVGFDPVGFSNWIDIKFLQEAEIKHCRVAMLGVLGFVITEFIKLPGDVHAVSSVAAHDAAVESGAMSQILIWTSAFEALSVKAVQEMLAGSGRQPGEFGFDPLKFSMGKSKAVQDDYVIKELSNGRLAMLAFGGIITQAVLSGKGFPYF